MMRILITGALGYVGPLVSSCLRDSYPDAEIVGLDAGFFAAQHDGEEPSPDLMLDQLLFKDVRDVGPEDLSGFTHVVQLAAISNDPMGDRFEQLTDDINHFQAVRIAHLARDAGAQGVVFASSASVYGAGSEAARSESSPLAPQTSYARSKVAAERELVGLATDSFAVTCLRFATACGWSPRVRLDLVLNDFVASALTVGRIDVLSDGTPWRPLIHVKDMARAVDWSISPQRTGAPPALVVNVGCDSWNYQIRDLAEAVAEELGVAVSIGEVESIDRRSYRLDFTRWRELAPNHQPMETLTSTIAELGSRLGEIADLDSGFRQSPRVRLVRLEQLSRLGFLDERLRWIERSHS